jgi:choline monooxygenase
MTLQTTPTAGGPTLPYRWYSDPEIAALEREQIFKRSWQYVGHLGELDGPGSFFAAHAHGIPVVVALDKDGVLRAFLNVCRHRGAKLAEGRQTRGTIQCPYHAWTYGLDGCLRAAPRSNEDAAFDRDALGLVPVAVDVWGPFVFCNPDADAAPLADTLGDLPEIVRDHGLDVDALRFRERFTYTIRANWKVAIENYLECYHCQLNHPGFVQAIDERRYRLVTHDMRASQFAPPDPRALDGTAPFDARGPLAESQFHLLFPALKFNVLPGHPNLSIGPVWPTGPQTCAGFYDYFFGEDASEDWIAQLYAFDAQVGAEDTGLVEAVQEGMANGVLGEGHVLDGAEPLIAHFQSWMRAALADA